MARFSGPAEGQRRERGRPVDDPWSVAMLERLAAAVTHFLTRTRTAADLAEACALLAWQQEVVNELSRGESSSILRTLRTLQR